MLISYGNALWDDETGDVDYIDDYDDYDNPNDEYDPYEALENAEYWSEREN